ncbi:MAG: hypothetical protein WD967_00260 [Candidatus Levyibacteriota bacterium]
MNTFGRIISFLLGLVIVAALVVFLIIPVVGWGVDRIFGGNDNGTQVATTNGTANSGSTVITEDRVREIVTEVVDKAVADNPALTAAQVKELVDKAVADAMDTLDKIGGLTEDRVREIVADVLRSTAAGNNGSKSGNGSGSGDGICRADKHATNSEVQNAGPQRMEVTVGGSDKLHLDYYRDRGVPAVSVIVNPGEWAVLQGFGSIWLFPSRDCGAFDNIADARDYAAGRPQWNHSGLVYASLCNYLENKAPVVNLHNVSTDSVRPTVSDRMKACPVSGQTSSTPASTGNGRTAATPSGGCTATSSQRAPVLGQPWSIQGNGPKIVSFWSNEPGQDQTEVKLLLKSDQNVNLLGGGTLYSYPSGCEQTAQKDFDSNTKTAVTLDQLRSRGLVK